MWAVAGGGRRWQWSFPSTWTESWWSPPRWRRRRPAGRRWSCCYTETDILTAPPPRLSQIIMMTSQPDRRTETDQQLEPALTSSSSADCPQHRSSSPINVLTSKSQDQISFFFMFYYNWEKLAKNWEIFVFFIGVYFLRNVKIFRINYLLLIQSRKSFHETKISGLMRRARGKSRMFSFL